MYDAVPPPVVPRRRDDLGYLKTRSGRRFYPLDPSPDDIVIEDIAHHLSNLCRFSGATSEFYSVGEHSVRVAHFVEANTSMQGISSADHWTYVLAALLHDGSEAYCIDLPRPIKRQPELAVYRVIEDRVAEAVALRFGLDPAIFEHPLIKFGDNSILAAEKRDLMNEPNRPHEVLPDPPKAQIVPRSPTEAKAWFLREFARIDRMRSHAAV